MTLPDEMDGNGAYRGENSFPEKPGTGTYSTDWVR